MSSEVELRVLRENMAEMLRRCDGRRATAEEENRLHDIRKRIAKLLFDETKQ